MPVRGRKLGDLVDVAEAVGAVLEASTPGCLDLTTAVQLLSAGHVASLLGSPESSWLEAKSAPWDLSTEAGKIELGRDVARFANASGGVIVVGATTAKRSGLDTIVKIHGIASKLLETRQVETTIDHRVYPPIEGLRSIVVPSDAGREVVAIVVPGQRDTLKPFLVHGMVVGGSTEGAFFSEVRRRGERSITTSARELHAWIAAGRQLLGDAYSNPSQIEPQLRATYEYMDGDEYLQIANDGPLDLADVVVHLHSGGPGWQPVVFHVTPQSSSIINHDTKQFGAIAVAAAKCEAVDRTTGSDMGGGPLRLRIECRATTGGPWVLARALTIPVHPALRHRG